MIDEHFDGLEAITSTKRACALLGASRSTRYRHRRPPAARPARPRPEPTNKLTEAERQRILAVLRSEDYCDLAPAQVWARLLDDGLYLCSISTMYRLLAVAGESRERRRQRSHPARKKPELIARRPNEVWSWDIQAPGPRPRRLLRAVCHHRHLQPLRGGLDGVAGGDRRAGRGLHRRCLGRPGHRA